MRDTFDSIDEVECLGEQVLVEPIPRSSPIQTPDGVQDCGLGIVRRVGPGQYAGMSGQFMPTTLNEGDVVALLTVGGVEPAAIRIAGKTYFFLRESYLAFRRRCEKDAAS